MSRLETVAVIFAVSMIFAAGTAPARKKQSPNPAVKETFEATITPPRGVADRVTIAVPDYSSSADVQNLADTFSQRGSDALLKTCMGIKKDT